LKRGLDAQKEGGVQEYRRAAQEYDRLRRQRLRLLALLYALWIAATALLGWWLVALVLPELR